MREGDMDGLPRCWSVFQRTDEIGKFDSWKEKMQLPWSKKEDKGLEKNLLGSSPMAHQETNHLMNPVLGNY